MAKISGLLAAFIVLSLWIGVVGNPHVVEKIIGLIFASVAGLWVFFKANKFGSPSKEILWRN